MKYLITLFLSVVALHASTFIEPDVEVKVLGLVCPSCAIGLKNIFKKHRSVKEVAIDTKKGLMLLDFTETKDGKVAWISNSKIIMLHPLNDFITKNPTTTTPHDTRTHFNKT